MDIELKINNLASMAKPFKHEHGFYLLKDHEGWSNGFIADLVGHNIELIQSQAKTKSLKDLFRFTIEKENCPEIKKIIPEVNTQEDVIDIQLDLEDKMAWLISEHNRVKINPTYLRYFVDNYKDSGYIFLKISEFKKPITVYQKEALIGLIMPLLTR